MANAYFEYRCRRCGKIEQSPVTNAVNGQMCLLAAIWNDASMLPETLRPQRPQLIATHYCGVDGRGVADLIGYSVVEDVPPNA